MVLPLLFKEAIEIRKRRDKTMIRDNGQYQLTHFFDEFLVPAGSKSPIGKQSGNPAVAKKKQRRQRSTPVTHLVLRKTVVSAEMYTVSEIYWIRYKELSGTYHYLPILMNLFNHRVAWYSNPYENHISL